MIKKIAMFIFTTLFMFSLTACGNGYSDGSSSSLDSVKEASSGKNIGDKEKSVSGIRLAGEDSLLKDLGNEEENVSHHYDVGDIVFANGSTAKAKEITAIYSDNLPVAVIAGFKNNGTAFGIGVHRSSDMPEWAVDNSTGYTTKFKDTVCVQEAEVTFSGDVDGNDNWNAICAIDHEGVTDDERNYPAFHFINTYAKNYGLAGGYASGWYMPGIVELCTVYENRETINAALKKIYGLDNSAAMDGLDTNWYWSSSQADSKDNYVWFVHYFNGYAGECPKNFTNLHVIAARDF